MQEDYGSGITMEYIIEKYGRLVTSICRRMMQNEDIVKDAVQEVWLEVFKSYMSFRNESKLTTWLYSVTSRIVMRLAKKEHQYSTHFLSNYYHGSDLEIPEYVDFDKRLWVSEMCDKCLTGTLHCLDNESRLAYIFRDITMLPYVQIAEILERDEALVRKMVSRSRNKLRNFLNDECILKNTNSRCKCRMSKWVKEVHLQEEYKKLQGIVNKINVYKVSEVVLPLKNYWLNNNYLD